MGQKSTCPKSIFTCSYANCYQNVSKLKFVVMVNHDHFALILALNSSKLLSSTAATLTKIPVSKKIDDER